MLHSLPNFHGLSNLNARWLRIQKRLLRYCCYRQHIHVCTLSTALTILNCRHKWYPPDQEVLKTGWLCPQLKEALRATLTRTSAHGPRIGPTHLIGVGPKGQRPPLALAPLLTTPLAVSSIPWLCIFVCVWECLCWCWNDSWFLVQFLPLERLWMNEWRIALAY